MKPVYTAGIKLYGLGARVAALRSAKVRDFVNGRRRALRQLEELTAKHAPDGYDYWFHVASLGEFEQARPLIEKIKSHNPEANVLLTFFSPSGYNVRKKYELATTVTYLPEDTKKNAGRLLDIARPRCVVFVKYEFWLNMLECIRERNIPAYLISAIFRPGQIFFKPWGGQFRECLRTFRTIYVQDEKSRDLLADIGITDVKITGDTRFDRVHDIMRQQISYPAIESWRADAFTLVVGSSWQPDEDRYIGWINAHPEVKVIIAPHEFDHHRLTALHKRLDRPSVLWTDIVSENGDITDIPTDTQTLIVNTFGKLASLYRYADAVIVGGGFGTGIHNINEAAVYGVPVIFGPNNRKFKEAADLKKLGGAFEYTTSDDIATLLNRMMSDTAFLSAASSTAGRYICDNLGATDVIFKDITSQA